MLQPSSRRVMRASKERRGMLSGDCNICINGKLPSDSATCVECGLSRKNYKPVIPASEEE